MRVLVSWPEPGAVAELLASRGHDVALKESAGSAPPEMVLLDGSLPGAAEACRAHGKRGAIVLALVARADSVLTRELLDAGADVVFPPLVPAVLEARVRAAETLATAREAQRRAEAAEAIAVERFEVLSGAAFEAIAVHADGIILYCNRTCATLFGITPEEAVGMRSLDFAAPEDRPAILANIAKGFDRPYRARALRRDGTTFPVEIRGRTVTQSGRELRIAAFRDLSAEVAAEAENQRSKDALARSEARFRQLIEEAPDAIAVVGTDGKFLFANRGVAAQRGFKTPEEVLGTSAADFLTPESRALFAQRTRDIFMGKPRQGPGEYDYRLPDGVLRRVEVVSLPIEFEGRTALLAFVRDVTERRRMEAHLRQSERMASLGLLAAGVAHEINNPLTFVTANLEFAAARAAALPEVARALDDAREGAARVAKIVRDLRVYARAEEEPPKPVHVREPLRFALAVTEGELRHRARVELELGEVRPVLAPEGRLGQVFVDLLTNAAHAIPEGAAGRHSVRVSSRTDGDWVEIDIEDSGSGIAPEHLPRLFEPFFTTKPAGQGTGLGLFTCHGIVRSLGGRIAVESEIGKGTRVRVTLPAAPMGSVLPKAHAPAAARAGVRHHVLVIDDEPSLGTALERLLEPDHKVCVELEAESALERLRRGETFDVILCDLMMPRMTGMDLHAELARSMPAMAARMVFLTGGAFTPRAQEFLERVGLPQIGKPFALEELMAAIEKAASGRR